MISDKKCRLMMFVDYLLVLLLGLFGLMFFSGLLQYSWGLLLYSVLFTLIFFGMIYSRCWKKAKSDLKYHQEDLRLSRAFRMTLPLTITFLLLIVLFMLIQHNIIPIRDLVTDVRYIIEENQPRRTQNIVLFDTLVPVMRILFLFVNGFHPADTISIPVLFIAPVFTVLAGFLGYYAGLKKFYFSEVVFKAHQKMKDKFNE